MRHALINPQGALVRVEANIDPAVPTRTGYRWLPYQVAALPAFDPATQVLEPPVVQIGAEAVTESRSVRAKTTAEIDAEKLQRVNALDLLVFRVLFDHENRLRVLEGRPSVTPAQFRAALVAAL